MIKLRYVNVKDDIDHCTLIVFFFFFILSKLKKKKKTIVKDKNTLNELCVRK